MEETKAQKNKRKIKELEQIVIDKIDSENNQKKKDLLKRKEEIITDYDKLVEIENKNETPEQANKRKIKELGQIALGDTELEKKQMEDIDLINRREDIISDFKKLEAFGGVNKTKTIKKKTITSKHTELFDDDIVEVQNNKTKIKEVKSNKSEETLVMKKNNLTKECPFCAEEIKQEAIFCKHCKSSLNEEETIEEEFSYSDFDGKKPPKKSKGNKLGGFIVLAVIIAVWAMIDNGVFDGYVSSYSSISDAKCSEVEKNAKGTELKNLFGGTFKVLQVKNSREISRTKDKLVCLGDLRLSNGNDNSKLRMELTLEGNQFWYKYSVE